MALNNEFKVKNDLNTLGRILSGGMDLATIFSPSNTSWTLSATNGNFGVAGGDTVQFQGSNGVDVRVATGTDTVRISGIDATASVKGVASFHADNFLVTNGVVTVKDGGILNAELAGSITDNKLSTISTALKVSNSATTATSANTANAIVERGAGGEFSSGSITSNNTVQAVTVNATTGFRVNNGATSGNVLRGNGTNFVSSAIQVSDVPTLNQSTSGSAATLGTTQTLWGQAFNGSQTVTGSLTGVGNIIGSSVITLSSGSGNNNINLTPSGTGLVTATGNLSASGTVTGNAVVASNITATNLLSAASTFTRQLSVGNVQVRTVGTSNVFLGDSTTGRNAATGNHNFVFGLSAGNSLTSGAHNIFIGYKAGSKITSPHSFAPGNFNNFLGRYAGENTVSGGMFNNFLGANAGRNNTWGGSNNFLGYRAGCSNTTGCNNNFLGYAAGLNNTAGGYNNFLGNAAGLCNTTGGCNNFLGLNAGRYNTEGCNNNFLGEGAGCFNRTGSHNIFIGNNANTASAQMSALSGVIVLGTGAVATQTNQIVLSTADISLRTLKGSAAGPNVFIGDSTTGNNNATGNHNFVFGLSAGNALTSGSNNVFVGDCAGYSNTIGGSNNFLGFNAGRCNTDGDWNNFLGPNAGFFNTTGCSNNFLGFNAGGANTEGSFNNFFGDQAGLRNTTGSFNNFLGIGAGVWNTTGGSNNFLGYDAGFCNRTGSHNNFLGNKAGCFNRTGSNNIFIGNNANTASAQTSALSGVIVLGTSAIATESHQIVLSTANASFRNIGSTFEIGTPSLTDNLTVYGAVSSTGIVNTNTGFRVNNGATSGNVLRGNGTNFVSSAIQVSDVPTLNQSTSGSAATLGTTQTLWGQAFNGSQTVTGSLTGVGNITGSGAITIQPFATNQDISLTTSGTGEVNIAKVDIDSGTIDGTTIGSSSASTGSFTQVVVDNITIDGNTISSTNANGNIDLTPNGTGEVNITKVDIDAGTIDGTAIGTASPATQLIVDDVEIDSATIGLKSGSSATALNINTRSGTVPIIFNGNNAGANAIISSGIGGDLILGTHLNNAANARLTLDDATNGNITFGLNGTGSVVIPKADINAGTIDGTSIGLSVPASGVFTGITVAGNVNISGNLFVSGSATQINTNNLVISDPIIFLAEGNQTDTVDIGFTAAYNHGQGIKRHTGLIRDSFTQQWTLFKNLSTEILSAVQIPLDNPSLQIDTLNANIIGTVTGNLSGMAAQIANGSVSTYSILNNAVTYAKIQNVSATDKILGRSTAGAGVVEEIDCTLAGRQLLDDASASAQRTTLGVGTTDSVTFGEVIVNNGTRSVLNDVFNASSSNNTHTLTTFAKANYNSAKFTVQIKQGNNRCLFEVLTTNDNGTWNGTVYGLVGADLLENIDITTISTTVDLAFTFKGTATARTMTVYAQAISD